MIYQIQCLHTGEIYFLKHDKLYTHEDFQNILVTIRFELSHNPHTHDILQIICSDYGFQQITY